MYKRGSYDKDSSKAEKSGSCSSFKELRLPRPRTLVRRPALEKLWIKRKAELILGINNIRERRRPLTGDLRRRQGDCVLKLRRIRLNYGFLNSEEGHRWDPLLRTLIHEFTHYR